MGGYPGVEAEAVNFSDLHTEFYQGPPETWVPGPTSPVTAHLAVVILLDCLHVGAAAGHRVVDEQNDDCADYGD
jgi:hypothetical protein